MANHPGNDTKALVTGIYLNEYDRVVKPQQRFLIPNYFIEYWVNRLGPTLSWIVVSLQQACWRENSDQCTISQSLIADEIGMERRTVGRVLRESPVRHWFIPDIEDQKGIVHRASKTYQPLPHKYTVYLSIPLTPEHMAGLCEYFRQECPTASLASIEQAIHKLLALNSREALTLLEQYQHAAMRQFEAPLPLLELVEVATGLKIKDPSTAKAAELEQKLSGLHTHLTEIGHTICRQYFRLNWVPQLGPAMAWLVMALRSRCYYNPDKGELRDVCTWRKKELAAMIGQSRYNLRLLLAHPNAEHFFKIPDNQKQQITVRVSMVQEPLLEETASEFWSRQPRSLFEMPSSLKNVEKCDITPSKNVEICDMTLAENVEIYDSNVPKNVEKRDNTPLRTLKNVTTPHENVENSDSLKYSKESVLNVVENKDISTAKKDFDSHLHPELQELLRQAGLSGAGLSRLLDKEPPLAPWKVRAVLLYAKANNLGAGYIYSHLTRDAPVDELYLHFAALDEAILEQFQLAVGEIKMNGGGLTPDIYLSIPTEHIGLFAQFVEIFAGVEAANVATIIQHRQSVIGSAEVIPRAQLPNQQVAPLYDNLALASQNSLAASNRTYHLQDQAGEGEDEKSLNPFPGGSLQVTDKREVTEQREIEVLWGQVLGQLKLQMTRNTFDTWLKDTQLIAREGSKFTIAVSSGFAKDWLENRLLTTIQRTLVSFIQTNGDQKLPKVEIRFVVDAR